MPIGPGSRPYRSGDTGRPTRAAQVVDVLVRHDLLRRAIGDERDSEGPSCGSYIPGPET